MSSGKVIILGHGIPKEVIYEIQRVVHKDFNEVQIAIEKALYEPPKLSHIMKSCIYDDMAIYKGIPESFKHRRHR